MAQAKRVIDPKTFCAKCGAFYEAHGGIYTWACARFREVWPEAPSVMDFTRTVITKPIARAVYKPEE